MKYLFKILKISAIVCLVIIFLDTIFNNFRFSQLLDVEYWGLYAFYSIVLTVINSLYFYVFNSKIGWEGASLKRVFVAAIGAIVVTLVGFFFCRLIDKTVFHEGSFEEFIKNESINYYFFPLLFTTIVSLIFHLIYFYKALQEKKVKEQKIIAGTASAKFDALKNQLDPHFLFNSLNVLSSLIEENPQLAQKFTGSLSKIYRYVLEQKDKELVSLEEELKFARTYTDLLKVRFEEGLIFNLPSTIQNTEAKVVPLSLQLLLENTIKHNRVSGDSPLVIKIYEEAGNLVVENNLQPKEILKKGSGVGLNNIMERYSLVTNRKVKIEKTRNKFIVRIPLLTKLKVMEVASTPGQFENDSYLRAKEQVKKEREFYKNLISYSFVIPALAIFNYFSSNFPWVIFPAIGWGIGVTMHGMAAFNWNPFLGKDWEEKKIREFMEKDEPKNI